VSAAVETAWVKPALETGGLDHLGVRGPCIHIYGDLLPGINNVTDRIRYYSFYTWLIWSLDQQGHRSIGIDVRQRIRRADCLFTLIANFHALDDPGNFEQHAGALVGNLTLGPAVKSLSETGSLAPSRYSVEDDVPDRYFKNRLGGLGQYYLGSLRDVLLLAGDGTSGLRYLKERGRPLAEAFDVSVDGERFWKCIDSDSVTADDLVALSGFCPCALAPGSEEQVRLADILFGRDEHVIAAGERRRDTLNLYMHLAAVLHQKGLPLDVETFRGAVYSGALGDGQEWPLPEGIDKIRQRWRVYATNEILSLGLQGLFYGVLSRRLEDQKTDPVGSAQELAAWTLATDTGAALLKRLGHATFADALATTGDAIPALQDWRSENHELCLASAVSQLGDQDLSDEVIVDVMAQSVQTLLSLAARLVDEPDPYSHVTFPPGYFDYYPLNLRAFMVAVRSNWQTLSFEEWLAQLIADWTVNPHIRVALRKLRSQSKATFQVRPSDEGLVVVDVPTPEFSSPRFRQGRQALIDLGALRATDNERFELTELGRSLMGDSHG
jgi:hypothetical protein